MLKRSIGIGLAGAMVAVAQEGVREVYVDADDGGRHAVIEASLHVESEGEQLVLRIRPHGPGVEREAGWQSRDGFNAHTARELASVLRAKGFEAQVRGVDGGLRPAQVEWEKNFASFPRRRLLEDRSLDYLARTESLVSELILRTTGTLKGTEGLELRARGESRLRLQYDLKAGRVTGMGMPGHSGAIPIADLVAEQEAVEALPLPENWLEMETEAKWKWCEIRVRDDVARRARLVAALQEKEDWLFLEQVALYSEGAFDTDGIGVILHAAKAPNWRRVAAWFGSVSSGHGVVHSNSLLASELDRGQSLGWVNKHPDRLDAFLKSTKAMWEKQGVVPVEPEGDLPPLVEDDILGGIGAAFGEGKERVDAATLATIARGIEGWTVSQRWGSPWGEKVVELIEHADWRVAQAACLAFTHGKNQSVPMPSLKKVAEDETKERRLREAAFLGWSYGNWGEVFVKLHDVASEPDHPLWSPAVSRLGELGNGWTLEFLGSLEAKGRKKKLLEQEREFLAARAAQFKVNHNFETTVWAIVLGCNRSGDMEEWLLKRYGVPEFNTDAVRKRLAGMSGWRGADLPPKVHEQRKAVRERLIQELEHRWKVGSGEVED